MFGKKNEAPQEIQGDVIKVEVEYNLKTNALKLTSKAPTVMLFGILEMAKSMVTQNQVLMRMNPKIQPATMADMPKV